MNCLKTNDINRYKNYKKFNQTNVTPNLKAQYAINGKSVLNFFIPTPLFDNESYTIKYFLECRMNLAILQSEIDYDFTTGNLNYFPQTIIDNFDTSITNSWQTRSIRNYSWNNSTTHKYLFDTTIQI